MVMIYLKPFFLNQIAEHKKVINVIMIALPIGARSSFFSQWSVILIGVFF